MEWFLYDRDLRHERVKQRCSTNIITKNKWVSIFHIFIKKLLRFIWISTEKKMCSWVFPCSSEFQGALSKTWKLPLTLGPWGNPFFHRTKWWQQKKNSNKFICGATQRNEFFHTSMKSSCAQKVIKTLFHFMNKFKDTFFYIKIIFDNVRRISNAHIVETTWRKKMCNFTIQIQIFSQDIKREKLQLRNVLWTILPGGGLIFVFRHISPQISPYEDPFMAKFT